MTALGVMMRGPETDVERIAEESRLAASRDALPVPLLAIHGEQDGIVAPRNTVALVRQYLRFNGHSAVTTPLASATALPDADAESRTAGDDGRIVTTREWKSNGRLIVRFVSVGGLGHAWSGGDGRFPYNDPAPPDATALIAAFARDAVP
jgi:poly(3-hydroxybutyrate) depolymerase